MMIQQYAVQSRFQYEIPQKYDEDFVLMLAPRLSLTDWVSLQRIVIRDTESNEFHLGIIYQVSKREYGMPFSYAVRIWEQTIKGETVVLAQIIEDNEPNEVIEWFANTHTALCAAADYLERPLRYQGDVYVPKEIPQHWYSEPGEQAGYDPRPFGGDSDMEIDSSGALDDVYRVYSERVAYRSGNQ